MHTLQLERWGGYLENSRRQIYQVRGHAAGRWLGYAEVRSGENVGRK